MESTMTTTTKLLTAAEVTRCKKIAASDTDYASARANALLALHQGSTQAETAVETGLTIGQVRYWVTRFRKLGMDSFSSSTGASYSAQAKTAVKATATKEVTVDKKAKKTKSKDKDKKKAKDDKPKKKKSESKKDKSDKKDKKKGKDKKKTKKKK